MSDHSPKVTSATTAVKPPRRRGPKPTYDFESLTEVGMSLGVKGRTARQLRTTIWNANKRHAPKAFFATDVDPARDPDGADCRIFRDNDKLLSGGSTG